MTISVFYILNYNWILLFLFKLSSSRPWEVHSIEYLFFGFFWHALLCVSWMGMWCVPVWLWVFVPRMNAEIRGQLLGIGSCQDSGDLFRLAWWLYSPSPLTTLFECFEVSYTTLSWTAWQGKLRLKAKAEIGVNPLKQSNDSCVGGRLKIIIYLMWPGKCLCSTCARDLELNMQGMETRSSLSDHHFIILGADCDT